MIRFFCIFIFVWINMSSGFSQNLLTEFKNLENQLDLQRNYPQSLLDYQDFIDRAESAGMDSLVVMAMISSGVCNLNMGKYKESLDNYKQAIAYGRKKQLVEALAEALSAQFTMEKFFPDGQDDHLAQLTEIKNLYAQAGNLARYSSTLRQIANFYGSRGNQDSALFYFDNAIRIKKEIKDSAALAVVFMDYAGFIRKGLNRPEESVEYYLQALAINDRLGKHMNSMISYNNLAYLFKDLKNFQRAHEYADKFLNIATRNKFIIRIMDGHILKAMIAIDQKDLATAERILLVHNHIADSIKNDEYIFKGNIPLLSIYISNKDKEKADSIIQIQDALFPNIRRNLYKHNYGLMLAKYFKSQHKYNQAIRQLQPVLEYAEKAHSQDLPTIYRSLATSYEKIGKYSEAFLYQKKYSVWLDSVATIEQQKTIQELEAKYERAKKDGEIALLNQKNTEQELAISKVNRQRLILGLSVFFLALVSILLFYWNRFRKRSFDLLEEKNVIISKALGEKETLLKEIHHRVKNNLQIITSLLSLQSKYIDDPAALDAIEEGKNRVKSMALIHQNLYQEDNLVGVEVKEYFEKLTQNLINTYKTEEKITFNTDIDPVKLDVDLIIPMGLIVNELITNSIKYAFNNQNLAKIDVSLKVEDDRLNLSVKDNGQGIPGHIDPKRAKSMGFRLIRALTDKMGAEIDIKGRQGTATQISVPMAS